MKIVKIGNKEICVNDELYNAIYMQGRADERKDFEDLEMGLSEEDKRRVLNDFGNWLAENGYESSCHNIKAWITEYENKDKKGQI